VLDLLQVKVLVDDGGRLMEEETGEDGLYEWKTKKQGNCSRVGSRSCHVAVVERTAETEDAYKKRGRFQRPKQVAMIDVGCMSLQTN
jgi:hypothetical protein